MVAQDSLVLRHALRVGLVTAVAVWLAGALGLPRGYWVTITVVIILQPYTGATTLKAVQRSLGTVVGGVLTAALGALFHNPIAILVTSFIFAAISVAVLPINYTAFSVFLTPTFVLLAEASAGDWDLAGIRVFDTLLGGALALLGARVLWPAPEWKRLPSYLAASLRANSNYLRTVVTSFADRSDEAGRLMRARRRDCALAAINAEESFQRLMGEHGGSTETLAPVMHFLTYARRFKVSIGAIAVRRHAVDPSTATALEHFIDYASTRLGAAAVVVAGTSEANTSVATSSAGLPNELRSVDPVLRARLTRLARHTRIRGERCRRAWHIAGSLGPLRAGDHGLHGAPDVTEIGEERLQGEIRPVSRVASNELLVVLREVEIERVGGIQVEDLKLCVSHLQPAEPQTTAAEVQIVRRG